MVNHLKVVDGVRGLEEERVAMELPPPSQKTVKATKLTLRLHNQALQPQGTNLIIMVDEEIVEVVAGRVVLVEAAVERVVVVVAMSAAEAGIRTPQRQQGMLQQQHPGKVAATNKAQPPRPPVVKRPDVADGTRVLQHNPTAVTATAVLFVTPRVAGLAVDHARTTTTHPSPTSTPPPY